MSTTTGKLVFGCGLVLCMIALGSILLSQDGSLQNRAGDNPLEFEVAEKPQRLVVVTRVHMKSASSMPDTGKVLSFIQNTKLYSDGIIICVGASDVTQINLYIDSVVHLLDERHEDHSTVIFLPVFPWGYFTTSLNAAILVAQDQMFDLIAFQV